MVLLLCELCCHSSLKNAIPNLQTKAWRVYRSVWQVLP